MTKKELTKVFEKGNKLEIAAAIMEYLKEVNFYKRPDPVYNTAQKLFS